MIRSLFSGVTGMKNHQTYMDVVGDNVTNINTIGFKQARASFQDTLNGLMTNMDSGGLKTTGRTLDLAINGNGFFKVVNPADGKEYYTREGTFYIDQSGYLVNSQGYRLIGDLKNITAAKAALGNSFVTISDLSGNDTAPTVTGIKEFALLTAADTDNLYEVLSLQGTMSDGLAGKLTDFTIETAQRAVFTQDTLFDLKPDDKLSKIGLVNGDLIEFSMVNGYTGESASCKFRVINSKTQTLSELQQFIAEKTNNKIQMYFTQSGKEVPLSELDPDVKTQISFRTADYGPKVKLEINTKDDQNNDKVSFWLRSTTTGKGDDIDSIVAKINQKTADTGVMAWKTSENKLVLSSLGTGEKAVLRFSGNAAALLGLPVTGTIDIAAGTTQQGNADFARIQPSATDAVSETLSLMGTLADGTTGTAHDFQIETAQRAQLIFDKNVSNIPYSIAAGGLTTLQNIDASFADGDILRFTYVNNYKNENVTFDITIEKPDINTLDWLQKQIIDKVKEKNITGEIEMFYTDNGSEVPASFLDYDGDEGIGFRTTDYGPGVSLSVVTLAGDGSGTVKDIFNGIRSGSGDDIDTIVEKINAKSDTTGVVAKNVGDKLLLETSGVGETAVLRVSGDAAKLLNLPVTAANETVAVTGGFESYARITPDETSNDSEFLVLQGTLEDGTEGEIKKLEIKKSTIADINAGDDYNLSGSTKLNSIGLGFAKDDKIKVSYSNKYDPGSSGSFTIEIDDPANQDIEWLKGRFAALATESGINEDTEVIEMYYTGSKIGFRTADYGPGVSLTVSTVDKDGNEKTVFNGANSDLNTGTCVATGDGDDIDTIVARINQYALVTGVKAENVDNKLQLETLGAGENSVLRISGNAADLIGLPVTSNTVAVVKGKEQHARITAGDTNNNAETLSLRGTMADGTPGQMKDITVEKATAADIYAGDGFLDSSSNPVGIDQNLSTKLQDLGFANGDKVEFIIQDKYGNDESYTYEVTDNTKELNFFKSDIENKLPIELYFTNGGVEVAQLTDLDGSGDEGFGFRTKNAGPGVTLTITTRDAGDNLKNILGGNLDSIVTDGPQSASGGGDDIDTVVQKINALKNDTGVIAANVDGNLILKTIGQGEEAVLSVSGDAAAMLGLQQGNYSSATNTNTPATAGGTKKFTVLPSGITDKTLTLEGTKADGITPGTPATITVEKATEADIYAGDGFTIASDLSTAMDTFGFNAAGGDKVEFRIQDKYNGIDETFFVIVGAGDTLQDFKTAIANAAQAAGLEDDIIQLYFTDNGVEKAAGSLTNDGDEGFGFRTKNAGPGVTLTITTRDSGDNLKNILGGDLGSIELDGPWSASGGGDDIDTVVQKINDLKDDTGVIAINMNNTLVLETVGEGKNAKMSVTGDAAAYFGLSTTDNFNGDVYRGTTSFTVFSGNSDYTGNFAENTSNAGTTYGTSETTATLSLVGTKVDGTPGDKVDIIIEAARQAVVNAGESHVINAAEIDRTTMGDLGFLDGDEVEFTITNTYDPSKSQKFSVSVLKSQSLKEFQKSIKDQTHAVEMYFTQSGLETAYENLDGSGDEGFGFRTADCGPGITLSVIAKRGNNTIPVFEGANSDFNSGAAEKKGLGDDLDSIINKINDQTAFSGVTATKDTDNKLVLKTVDISNSAKLQVSGNAAEHLALDSKVYENTGSQITDALKIKDVPIASININGSGVLTGIDNLGKTLQWDSDQVDTSEPGGIYPDIAQIMLYSFANQNGLKRVGYNLFVRSDASGVAFKGKPGEDGYGTIESGSLEMSNVDMTDEFSSMITTQRGYQANARMVTVSDTMLEELLNLKR